MMQMTFLQYNMSMVTELGVLRRPASHSFHRSSPLRIRNANKADPRKPIYNSVQRPSP